MKARIKATGEIVEVAYLSEDKYGNKYYKVTTDTRTYRETELEMMSDKGDYFYTYDYWTRLEHRYAGMAMQGMIKRAYNTYCDDCANYENMIFEDAQALLKDHAEALADVCVEFAHALVEKMKEKEERK